MILFPAIDVRNGRCVRLTQGNFDRETVFAERPAEQALEWEKAGSSFLHVVDLDAARTGTSGNEAAVAEILRQISIPVQLGGGIRGMKDIEKKLTLGVARVILGTIALKDPGLVRSAVRAYGERIVVGVDSKDGYVAVEGWGRISAVKSAEFCAMIRDLGVRTLVYTDIAKDGMMTGPNLSATKDAVALGGIDVIASGGVASLSDLRALEEIGVRGVVIGRALYDGAIDLKEAIDIFEHAGPAFNGRIVKGA
ncbi:MAG: 1-(5-phosphoribosyl)-5-[(5-phosphoribosylamino)methylideneamino]imidazole-4-carboxamide isomerase [Synergistaceae bacterium]|nr:1-(5-phosphoribosyl)-5-[(5-phosphoribosylamino)methylideneamino]imidazole-4-carboxamide isomerase [Synergistaceae bacterium]